jgi:hypothetical protein
MIDMKASGLQIRVRRFSCECPAIRQCLGDDGDACGANDRQGVGRSMLACAEAMASGHGVSARVSGQADTSDVRLSASHYALDATSQAGSLLAKSSADPSADPSGARCRCVQYGPISAPPAAVMPRQTGNAEAARCSRGRCWSLPPCAATPVAAWPMPRLRPARASAAVSHPSAQRDAGRREAFYGLDVGTRRGACFRRRCFSAGGHEGDQVGRRHSAPADRFA